jgi:hypothetical protein
MQNTAIALDFDGNLTQVAYSPVRDQHGKTVVPDSATLKIAGTVAAGAVTVEPVTGRVLYDWHASEIAQYTLTIPTFNVRLEWTFDVGGTDYERVQYIDIVKHELYTGINTNDLETEVPDIRKYRTRISGWLTGGTASAPIDGERLRTQEPNRFRGSELEVRSGANAGAHRQIAASDPITGEIELEAALTYVPSVRDSYSIHISWDAHIRRSWETLQSRLSNYLGRRDSARILDEKDLRQVHFYLSIAHVISSFGQVGMQAMPVERLKALSAEYRNRYQSEFNQLVVKLDYADTETGVIEQAVMPFWGRCLP